MWVEIFHPRHRWRNQCVRVLEATPKTFLVQHTKTLETVRVHKTRARIIRAPWYWVHVQTAVCMAVLFFAHILETYHRWIGGVALILFFHRQISHAKTNIL